MSATVSVRRGAVYLSAAVCETYLADVRAVIVLIRDDTLMVLPVRQMASGGCLLKIRNAAGDRVASAPDVFESRGLLDWAADGLAAHWSAADGALVVPLAEGRTVT